GKVPVLLHDTQTVWDSLAICEYLAETFPTLQWWPEDKAARALARSISAEMHSGFQNLRQNMPMNCRTKYPGKGLASVVQQDIDRITSIWQESRQKIDLFGENPLAFVLLAEVDGDAIGLATYHFIYSSFL
ncbi:MAG: glutathione S-transferase family protein, partial [Nostoc sp.]